MKTCVRLALLTLFLATPVLIAPAEASGVRSVNTSSDVILPEAGDPLVVLATLLGTGFEGAEGFALGPIEPQNGWTASGVSLPYASISGANPASGSQHLRLVRDGSVVPGTLRVILGPTFPAPANSPSQTKILVNLSNDGGSSYDVIGQAPSQGFITWRVRFNSDNGAGGPGTIWVLDNTPAGLAFVNTGTMWTEGAYREFKVQFDPTASQIRYFYGGVQIYTGSIFAGTAVEQFGVLHNNVQVTGESGDFDDLQIIDSASDPVPVQSVSWGRIKGQYR